MKPHLENGELRMGRWPKDDNGKDLPVLEILVCLGAPPEVIEKYINPLGAYRQWAWWADGDV